MHGQIVCIKKEVRLESWGGEYVVLVVLLVLIVVCSSLCMDNGLVILNGPVYWKQNPAQR